MINKKHMRTKTLTRVNQQINPSALNYELADLKKLLLSHGGKKVVLPKIEEDLYDIITRGQVWNNNEYLYKGEMCQCHKNSILYWKEHKNTTFFATGYALSDKGTWHQHSWIVTKQENVIETTVNRVKYFGFLLDNLEAEIFLDAYNDSIMPCANIISL